jgi:hypothetical protein
MRRRRRHLEVSTFPFLAVLLCTMGSLILLLLVLDRRAKIVAVHKAHEEAAQMQADRDRRDLERRRRTAEEQRLAIEQQAEFERRRQQLHTMLAEQEQDLLGKIAEARGQVASAETKLHEEEARAERLKNDIQVADFRLTSSQQALQAQQSAAASAARMTEDARRELQSQALALEQMEQALASLKALRERQKNTYSLVPYLGKRGESRRPLYVECAAGGLVFHPDALPLQGPLLTDAHIREEVLKRIERQRPQLADGKAEQPPRPYLLMLVRPDGITNYYAAMGALAGLKVDFGYEFIESDWVLDFSAETGAGPPQPWMTASTIPSNLPPSALLPRNVVASRPPFPGGGGFDAVGREQPSRPGEGGVGASIQGSRPGGFGGDGLPGPPPIPGLPQIESGRNRGSGAADSVWRPALVAQNGSPTSGSVPGGMTDGLSAGTPNVAGNASGAVVGNGGTKGNGLGGGNQAAGTGTSGVSMPFAGGSGGMPNGLPPLQSATGASGGSSGSISGSKAVVGQGSGGTGPGGAPNGTVSGGGAPGPGGSAGPSNGSGSPNSGGSSGGTPGAGASAGTSNGSGSPRGEGSGSGSAPGEFSNGGGGAAGGGPAGGSAAGAGAPGGPTSGGGPPSGGKPGPDAPGASAPVGVASSGDFAGGGPPNSSSSAGASGGEGVGGDASVLRSPLLAPSKNAGSKFAPAPLGRVLGNRDWILYVECHAEGIVLKYGNKKFSLPALAPPPAGEHELAATVRLLIARKQATVGPGEPSYRPMVRFQVWPDGLRAYYLAYPLLQPLGIPMARENVLP